MEGSPRQRRHLMNRNTVLESPKYCVMHSVENQKPFDQIIVTRKG